MPRTSHSDQDDLEVERYASWDEQKREEYALAFDQLGDDYFLQRDEDDEPRTWSSYRIEACNDGSATVTIETNDDDDDGVVDLEVARIVLAWRNVEGRGPGWLAALKQYGPSHRGAYGQPVDVYFNGVPVTDVEETRLRHVTLSLLTGDENAPLKYGRPQECDQEVLVQGGGDDWS
jgi:hypothetical protein